MKHGEMIRALSAVAEGPRASPGRLGVGAGPRQRKDLDSLVLPEAVHQVLEPLLAARDRPHVRVSAERPLRQRRKVEAALEDLLAERLAPALVAALPGTREPPVRSETGRTSASRPSALCDSAVRSRRPWRISWPNGSRQPL